MIDEKSNFKPKHVLPDIERIVPGKFYAFTINASEDNPVFPQQLEYYENAMLNLYKLGLYYDLYPEYSSSMKLHYHGYVKFKNYHAIIPVYTKLQTFKSHFTFTLKEIYDYQWHIYCTKQRHIMNSVSTHHIKPYRLTIPTTKLFTCYPVDNKSQFLGLD